MTSVPGTDTTAIPPGRLTVLASRRPRKALRGARFTAGVALAVAYSLVAQFGLHLHHGRGQIVKSVIDVREMRGG